MRTGRSGCVNAAGVRGKLYFLVGPPASGKSTFANAWAMESPTCWSDAPGRAGLLVTRPRVVVAGDDFRQALTGHEYLPHAEMVVSGFIDVAVLALLSRGFDVLVDDTSSSEMTLMRYFRADPDPVPIFMDTPVDVCKERAVANGRPYLLPVIDRIAAQLAHLRANWGTIVTDLKRKVEHRLHSDSVVPKAD